MSHDQDTTNKVAALLRDCNVMSLATCEGNRAWAASVFFVADDAFKLYFISGEGSRHIRHITSNSRVAATVNKDHDDWLGIRGLQIEGRVEMLPAREAARVLSRYLEKFPSLSRLCENPADAQEKLIAERLMSANFYRLVCNRIRLIDNSQGFGFKAELELSAGNT